ncbi:MAG: MarR family transcriptional regulator [Myxococcaceae bacterium]|nr:MarR family transcriptional regulator [Myxococcaceae bacterium]
MEDGEKDGLSLTPDDHQFIEAIGRHFEDEGIPRIGGRLLGLLILAEKPLSLGRIAELLKVSPASVSTNVRLFHTRRLIEEISYPGDRRHYYTFSDAAWEHQFQSAMGAVTAAQKIFRGSLARLRPEEHVRCQRMSQAIEFFQFMHGVLESALGSWRNRSQEPAPASEATPSRTTS